MTYIENVSHYENFKPGGQCKVINKDILKGYVLGAISVAVLGSTVFAAPVQKTITAAYNDIKIYVDGALVQPKDASGKTVEPFISGGTTYLPVRAVGEAFNKEVKWDGDTNSVFIGTLPEDETSNNKPEEVKPQQEVTVGNAEEFVKAIGPDKKIVLKPGTYNLTEAANKIISANIKWDKTYDGYRLELIGVDNLTIQGDGDKPVDIVAEPRYSEIFTLLGCNNITFKNIRAGHTIIPDNYECNAGVLYIQDSQKINILDSILYGCGAEGIFASNVTDLSMKNSVIEKCNLRIMDLINCRNFTFDNSKFRNCKFESMFMFSNLENVVFSNCEISENKCTEGSLIEIYSNTKNTNDFSKDIKFINSKFINNTAPDFCGSVIDTSGSQFEGNSFDKK